MKLMESLVDLVDDEELEKSSLKEVDEFWGISSEIFLLCDAVEKMFELSYVADIFFSFVFRDYSKSTQNLFFS